MQSTNRCAQYSGDSRLNHTRIISTRIVTKTYKPTARRPM
jgi:hypothetical protein